MRIYRCFWWSSTSAECLTDFLVHSLSLKITSACHIALWILLPCKALTCNLWLVHIWFVVFNSFLWHFCSFYWRVGSKDADRKQGEKDGYDMQHDAHPWLESNQERCSYEACRVTIWLPGHCLFSDFIMGPVQRRNRKKKIDNKQKTEFKLCSVQCGVLNRESRRCLCARG